MTGTTYFLIVGVEHYNDPGDFQRVNYAENDALEIASSFQNLGHDAEDFVILINQRATRTSVIEHLKAIASKAMPNDRIIFYFAGHGFSALGANLLAPVDAMKTALTATSISTDSMLGILKTSQCKKT